MAADLPVKRAGLLLILLAAGCAEPPPAPKPQPRPAPQAPAQAAASLDQWAQCSYRVINEIDDGRSDASTIAVPVRNACRQYYPAAGNGDLQLAIEGVLWMRARKAKQAAQETPASRAAWTNCVSEQFKAANILAGSISVMAMNAAAPCRHLYRGQPGQDVAAVGLAIERIREQHNGGAVVGPGQTLPPVDKKY